MTARKWDEAAPGVGDLMFASAPLSALLERGDSSLAPFGAAGSRTGFWSRSVDVDANVDVICHLRL
jgi:hypothetical protein